MNITDKTPRSQRSIGGKRADGQEISFDVSVPQPYAAGTHTLSEGEANALNQIIAENLSNNLRKKLVDGLTEGEGDAAKTRPYTEAEAQALVDSYLAEYEIGVRRAGSGERTVTDPVEREARKIARSKAVEMVKGAGGKPADYDLGPIIDKIFDGNRDLLMREGKKIVDAANRARENGGINLEGIDLTPKPAAPANADAAEGAAA
jgi:hypothetical protein